MKSKLQMTLYGRSKIFVWIFLLQIAYFNQSLALEAFSDLNLNIVVDVTVTGTVTDDTGKPTPGVTVSVPGTTIGTATDINGNYSLNVPEGSTLVFSFIGFETQRIEV